MKLVEIIEELTDYQVIYVKHSENSKLLEVQASKTIVDLFLLKKNVLTQAAIYFLYEPETHLFWWSLNYKDKAYYSKEESTYDLNSFLEESNISLSNSNLLTCYLWSTRLSIQYSKEQYPSFEQARSHFFLLLEQQLEVDSSCIKYSHGFNEILLSNYINSEFFRIRGDFSGSGAIRPATVSSVEYHDSHWHIELEGNDNRGIPYFGIRDYEKIPRIKAVVVLDNDYNVVDVIAEDFLKKIV